MFTSYTDKISQTLQRKFTVVGKSHYNLYQGPLRELLKYIETESLLKQVLEEAKPSCKEETIQLLNSLYDDKNDDDGQEDSNQNRYIELGDNEQENAYICFQLLSYIAADLPKTNLINQINKILNLLCVSSERYHQDCVGQINQQLLERLIQFLFSKIERTDYLLHLLARYKGLCEWFEKEKLFQTQTEGFKEEVLDMDLRKFLFNSGLDCFSQVKSPTGKVDILPLVEGRKQPIEVKLFCPEKSYGANYLAQGFRQAIHYANDYHSPTGYLVVFNLSSKFLQIDDQTTYSEEQFISNNIPYITHQNKTIFIIVINIGESPSASKSPKDNTVRITKEDLVTTELITA